MDVGGQTLSRDEPKVMFSVRLPGPLVERVSEWAEAQGGGPAKAELVETALEAELDRREREDVD